MNASVGFGRHLRRQKCDALVLRLPENIVMAAGVWPMNGFSLAVVTAEAGPVALLAPSCEDEEMGDCWAGECDLLHLAAIGHARSAGGDSRWLCQVARRHKLTRPASATKARSNAWRRRTTRASFWSPAKAPTPCSKNSCPQARWLDATALLHELRAVKTPQEIGRLRVAHRVARFGLDRFHDAVSAWCFGGRACRRGLRGLFDPWRPLAGVRHINVYPQVSSGPNARAGVAAGRNHRRPPPAGRRNCPPGTGGLCRRFLGRRDPRQGGRQADRASARRSSPQ